MFKSIVGPLFFLIHLTGLANTTPPACLSDSSSKQVLPGSFATTYALLPQPIYDENPGYIDAYKKAWELAYKNVRWPNAANGFRSWYVDPGFNDHIFAWDSAFISLFTRYGQGVFPGIEALDNFYVKQYPDTGEISREISQVTGKSQVLWENQGRKSLFSRRGFEKYETNKPSEIKYTGRTPPKTPPHLTLDSMNHPLFAWAELQSYQVTGNRERLAQVYNPIKKYYESLQTYLRQGNGLYMTDWASFDNSVRNPLLTGGGVAPDISSEMAAMASQLKKMAAILGKPQDKENFSKDFAATRAAINTQLWSDREKFFVDKTAGGAQGKTKTIAGFFPLLEGISTPEHTDQLIRHLQNPKTFGSKVPVTTLSIDDPQHAKGTYWNGDVWTATNALVIQGLEDQGRRDVAQKTAMSFLKAVNDVYKKTGTFWENYSSKDSSQGKAVNGQPSIPDFVGWGGVAPIDFFIRYAIGINVSAPDNKVTWNISTSKTNGLRQLRFGCVKTDLLAQPSEWGWTITTTSNSKYDLEVNINGSVQVIHVLPGTHVTQITAAKTDSSQPSP